MVQRFKDKFGIEKIRDELWDQYEEIMKYLDDSISNEDKPPWAKQSDFERLRSVSLGSKATCWRSQ